jgi:hypothetical protein
MSNGGWSRTGDILMQVGLQMMRERREDQRLKDDRKYRSAESDKGRRQAIEDKRRWEAPETREREDIRDGKRVKVREEFRLGKDRGEWTEVGTQTIPTAKQYRRFVEGNNTVEYEMDPITGERVRPVSSGPRRSTPLLSMPASGGRTRAPQFDRIETPDGVHGYHTPGQPLPPGARFISPSRSTRYDSPRESPSPYGDRSSPYGARPGSPGTSRDTPVEVSDPSEVAALPPGTWVRLPSGMVRQR